MVSSCLFYYYFFFLFSLFNQTKRPKRPKSRKIVLRFSPFHFELEFSCLSITSSVSSAFYSLVNYSYSCFLVRTLPVNPIGQKLGPQFWHWCHETKNNQTKSINIYSRLRLETELLGWKLSHVVFLNVS